MGKNSTFFSTSPKRRNVLDAEEHSPISLPVPQPLAGPPVAPRTMRELHGMGT